MKKIIIPKVFEALARPNYTEEERARLFTPQRKAEIRARLLRGETVEDWEIGFKEFVLKGGRISGKTETDDKLTVQCFFGEPGDIWVTRSEENTLRKSVVASMQKAIHDEGFTISNRRDTDFRISYSPFEITCNRTGNACQFFAINKDINRTKGMMPPSGKLKKIILEEANEPDSEDYVIALKSTALRFCDEMTKFVYRYNPPPSLNHWANRYYPNISGATIIHSTWEDIAELLEPPVIADILKMKREDPVHYDYWFGGEIVSLAGLVIWAFDRKKHVMSVAELQRRIAANLRYQPAYMFYGVDSGITSDATAVSAWGLYPDGLLIKLGTMFLDIKEMTRRTGKRGFAHTDQVNYMLDWYRNFRENMKNYRITIPDPRFERWCFDGAALTQDLMLEWEKLTHFYCVAVTNKDVERDIARLNNSYLSGMLNILDVPENRKSVEEMETFARNEDNEIPEGQSDHTVDADKYATYEYYYDFL